MAKELNGFARKILISVAAVAVCGSAAASLVVWRTYVTRDDVREQIRIESPYLADQPLVRRALDKQLPRIERRLDDVHTEQMQQRGLLEAIHRNMGDRDRRDGP